MTTRFEEIVCNGWAERHQGEYKVRRNPRHIERVREAIRIRLDRETEFWVV